MPDIADILFEATFAESALKEQLSDAGVEYERLGWDYYDCSLEIYDVPDDYRLSPAAQEVIHKAGFRKVYVNHANKWETHYSFVPGEFAATEGWRVSYPHKRGEGKKEIWVEKHIPGWPKDWFDTGYVVIKSDKAEAE